MQPAAYLGVALTAVAIAASALLATSEVRAADGANPPAAATREVNVTADSAPGWVPSVEQDLLARKTVSDFFSAKDGGRAAEAYAFFAVINQRSQPLAKFSESLASFNALAGAVKERRLVTVTWTKDPAKAPAPGVYAAIDLVSRFANIDRHCGYLILYQAPVGGDFRVMREEENYLDNATARSIEAQGSKANVDAAWSRLSTHCPNYSGPTPLAEQPGSTIGYPTVTAALADLRSRPGVVITTQEGWTLAREEASGIFWAFPPIGHPAYPSAVKRRSIQQGNDVVIDMNIHCEASKPACDELVRSFQRLNAQMLQNLERSR